MDPVAIESQKQVMENPHELMELVQEACDYLDSSLGDADGLLLHGFVDGHLIFNVHLVELVDAAHTLRGEERPSASDAPAETRRCS